MNHCFKLLTVLFVTFNVLNATYLNENTKEAMGDLFSQVPQLKKFNQKKDIMVDELKNTFNAFSYFLIKKNKVTKIEFKEKECKQTDSGFQKCNFKELELSFSSSKMSRFIDFIKIKSAYIYWDETKKKIIDFKLNEIIGVERVDKGIIPKLLIDSVTGEDTYQAAVLLSSLFKPTSTIVENIEFYLNIKGLRFTPTYFKVLKEKNIISRNTEKNYLPLLFPAKKRDGVNTKLLIDLMLKKFDNKTNLSFNLKYDKDNKSLNNFSLVYNNNGRNLMSFVEFDDIYTNVEMFKDLNFKGDRLFSPGIKKFTIIAYQKHFLNKLKEMQLNNKKIEEEFKKLKKLRITKNTKLKKKSLTKESFSKQLVSAVTQTVSPFVYLEKEDMYLEFSFKKPMDIQTLFSILMQELFLRKSSFSNSSTINLKWN